MKWLLLLLINIVLGAGTFAQEIRAKFSYQFIANNFSTVCDLYYNGRESAYVLYDESLKIPNDTTVTSNGGANQTRINVKVGDGKDFVLYKNYADKTMISREILVTSKKCIVHDSIPELNWKLGNERKRIGPYDCQKATTTFRCATYVVWFTTAIPLNIGPWKLGGLPGLIVDAVNTSSNFRYTLLSADYPTTKSLYPISPPTGKDKSYSFVDFARIQQKEIDKMVVYLKSMTGNSSDAKINLNIQECYSPL